MRLQELALVALGGGSGALARYLLGSWTHALFPAVAFPIGTLLVNALGCLLIGVLAGALLLRPGSSALWLFLGVGVLGGFTTYSSFAWETLVLLRDSAWLRAGLNVLLQTVVALLAVAGGFALGRSAA